jgi:polyisoprenoid-binding protein YceI
VKGQYTKFEGALEVGADGAEAHGTVEVNSVDTREPQRDEHLRSADFFEVAKYPRIDFRSTAIRPAGEDGFEIDGDLEIHGVRKAITLRATLEGTETDPQGNDRVGLSASAQIDRSDFEMKFNAALGSGNLLVSDKVKILLDISAVKDA